MKPAPFDYHEPLTVNEATSLMAEYDEAELMAGNQSLSIQLSTRLATPDHIIDLNNLSELDYIDERDDEIEIGGMTRHATIASSDVLDRKLPILADAAGEIAGPAVRNMGTMGGGLAEADPAGNYPTVITALDGTVNLRSADGTRESPADEFFIGYMFTDLQEGELIESVTIDTSQFPVGHTGMSFLELKRVPHTWPKLSAAGIVRVDDPTADEPVVEDARLAFANAADIPLRTSAAEDAVKGTSLTDAALDEAASASMEAATPSDEMQAEAEYKEEQVGVFARRALSKAYDRATEN